MRIAFAALLLAACVSPSPEGVDAGAGDEPALGRWRTAISRRACGLDPKSFDVKIERRGDVATIALAGEPAVRAGVDLLADGARFHVDTADGTWTGEIHATEPSVDILWTEPGCVVAMDNLAIEDL